MLQLHPCYLLVGALEALEASPGAAAVVLGAEEADSYLQLYRLYHQQAGILGCNEQTRLMLYSPGTGILTLCKAES